MDLLKSITHPEEVYALLHFKLGGCQTVQPKGSQEMCDDLSTCYTFLNMTSRSFAAVIQALDGELRDAVCIFYLVLRALDTVEDDMSIPNEDKIPMLRQFYLYLEEPDWKFMESTEKDKIVLEKFPVISSEFRKLKPIYREVISDITKRMGRGMTVYLDKAPDTMLQWDEYCHYVAGLVGIGLSRLFAGSKLEDEVVGKDHKLANSMGLFLQKTNIIRDYLEDVVQGRYFWPKEAWGKYTEEADGFSKPEKLDDAIACLNELVTNALEHIPDCLEYLSRLRNQTVFNFCAIPQVMAVATLERCYNNPNIFAGVVKIRKGEAVKMMLQATDLEKVKAIFTHFLEKIQERIPTTDPSTGQTQQVVQLNLGLSQTKQIYTTTVQRFFPVYVSCAMLISAIVWQYYTGIIGLYTE